MSYIKDAIRLPLGKVKGVLKHFPAEELAAILLKEICRRNNLEPAQIHDIILGNAFGTGGNMARNASFRAFPSNEISCTTIDSQCSSGLNAVALAHRISSQNKIIICGGMESVSLAPEKYYNKSDARYTDLPFTKAEFGPNNSDNDFFKAAENALIKFKISKEETLAYMFNSHRKARASQEKLEKYIFKNNSFAKDQNLKVDTDWAKLQTQNPIDYTNTARAADGAAVVLVQADPDGAIAKIFCCETLGMKPEEAPIGGIFAFEKLLKTSQISINEISAFEISDSFAVNALAFQKYFNIPSEKINGVGGIIAYGHAYGATGAVNLIHLLAVLERGEKGLVTVPAAGGQATAMLIEKL
jgi:acetyl-CoA C-acetyltransferase